MVLLKLFLVFLKVSVLAIGGAYSFLPLVEREVVEGYHWLDKSEFLEVVGIAEIIPGAISVKLASYAGYKIAGVAGLIVANFANLLVPATLVVFASIAYSKYKNISMVKNALVMVQFAVFAMIIATVLKLIDKSHVFEFKYLSVMAVSFVVILLTRIHPVFVIVGAGLLGAMIK